MPRDAEPLDPDAPPLHGPTLMRQAWVDVGFVHWFVPSERVAGYMPGEVRPDVLDDGPHAGLSAVGLVAFRMVGAGVGRGPRVPYLGTFWETNVRLYSVDTTGRRGVVFVSLDASRLAVVLAARSAGLPYRWARMRGDERRPGGVRELVWTARTRWPRPSGVRSRLVLRVGEIVEPEPVDVFVSARWGLHSARLGRSWYTPNRHEPWPLRRAELLALDDGLVGAAGFGDLASTPPDHVVFADRVSTTFGAPGGAGTPRVT